MAERFDQSKMSWFPDEPEIPLLTEWLTGSDQHWDRVKNSPKRSVYRSIDHGEAGGQYHIKHDHPVELRDVIKTRARPRVLREYKAGKALQKLGLPVVEAVACGWQGRNGVLITNSVANAVDSLSLWEQVRLSTALATPVRIWAKPGNYSDRSLI